MGGDKVVGVSDDDADSSRVLKGTPPRYVSREFLIFTFKIYFVVVYELILLHTMDVLRGGAILVSVFDLQMAEKDHKIQFMPKLIHD